MELRWHGRRRHRVYGILICTSVIFTYQTFMYTHVMTSMDVPEVRILPQMQQRLRSSLQFFRTDDRKNNAFVNNHNAFQRIEASSSSWDLTRGIVLCLHDDIVAMGVSLIRELRCLGNHEIIQVYHCFANELSDASRQWIQRNDPHVDIIDVCADMIERNEILSETMAESFQSYWIKPLALYHTNLTHVILMDADDIMLRNPADLRESQGYRDTGTLFFYDRVANFRKFFNRISNPHVSTPEESSSSRESNTAAVEANGQQPVQMLKHIVQTFDYAGFGLEGPKPSSQLLHSLAYTEQTAHEQDSSLLLIDKSRAGKAMEVLKHLIFNTRFHLRFSWGDKEAFWIAYELAHRPYYFSPFGLSLLNSVPNGDLTQHPQSMCGSMAHYLPPMAEEDEHAAPELLYVNGKALLDPFPMGIDRTLRGKRSRMFNLNPTHITPRYRRSEYDLVKQKKGFECINDMGSTRLPATFRQLLLRRRMHFDAVVMDYDAALDSCKV